MLGYQSYVDCHGFGWQGLSLDLLLSYQQVMQSVTKCRCAAYSGSNSFCNSAMGVESVFHLSDIRVQHLHIAEAIPDAGACCDIAFGPNRRPILHHRIRA